MKSFSSIQEVQSAINEIYNRLDTLSVKNWDRKQTRIVNAHPSVDLYDYVVRKELLEATGKSTIENVTEGSSNKCTFGLGINSLVLVGNNQCPPYIVARRSGLKLNYVLAVAGVAPTGSDIQIQTRVGSTPIFSTPLVIPAGSLAVVEKVDFAVSTFTFKQIILCDVLQAGSSYPGTNIVVVMVFE